MEIIIVLIIVVLVLSFIIKEDDNVNKIKYEGKFSTLSKDEFYSNPKKYFSNDFFQSNSDNDKCDACLKQCYAKYPIKIFFYWNIGDSIVDTDYSTQHWGYMEKPKTYNVCFSCNKKHSSLFGNKNLTNAINNDLAKSNLLGIVDFYNEKDFYKRQEKSINPITDYSQDIDSQKETNIFESFGTNDDFNQKE